MSPFDPPQANATAAAQHNAEFSAQPPGATGPRTEAGKQRTRLNAYKHGITGQIHIFTAGEHEAFEKHCQAFVQALAPEGHLEQELAQNIAEDRWRLKRARSLESNIFAFGQMGELDEPISLAMAQAQTWLAKGNSLQLLTLYQQRIERSITKNTAELRALQADRTAARHHALEEACLVAQLTKSQGETCRPEADLPSPEFVFSSAEIEQTIVRQQRLAEARALPKTSPAPSPGRQMPAAA